MSSTLRLCISAVFISLAHSNVLADEIDPFDQYMRNLKVVSLSDPKPVIANIASGFGASSGVVYYALSYTDFDVQTNMVGDDDGSIAIGLGLGDPVNSFGYELTLGITSVSTAFWGDGKFADEGNVSGKVHRIVYPRLGGQSASVAFGASNLTGWGSTKENPVNVYAAYSEKMNFGEFKQYGLAYSFGVGSAVSNAEVDPDFFAGVGVGYDNLSASISQIGKETHLGLTFFTSMLPGAALTVSQADALDKMQAKRLIATISYSFQLGK